MTKPHNLYFHVPYCASKCNYCAFYSHACQTPDWAGYCNSILDEIDWGAQQIGRADIPTIFFGGGTPSLMPTDVFRKIMERVADRFNILPGSEISMESNPGTLDDKRLDEFKAIGVNRLSVGVQSLSDDELKFLGRCHSAADAIRLINSAGNMGLRVSADFIYGLPGQSVKNIETLCCQINDLGINHCSMYELSIEENTPFSKMNLVLPDNDTMADMYNAIGDQLILPRYEVSNYATSGNECRHNQNVWDGDPYIGFGQAACGRPLVNNTWYEQQGDGEKFVQIDASTRALEKIITGMRTTRGVKLTDDVNALINLEFVQRHPELVIAAPDNRLKATGAGMLALNNLLVHLVK